MTDRHALGHITWPNDGNRTDGNQLSYFNCAGRSNDICFIPGRSLFPGQSFYFCYQRLEHIITGNSSPSIWDFKLRWLSDRADLYTPKCIAF